MNNELSKLINAYEILVKSVKTQTELQALETLFELATNNIKEVK